MREGPRFVFFSRKLNFALHFLRGGRRFRSAALELHQVSGRLVLEASPAEALCSMTTSEEAPATAPQSLIPG